MKKNNLESAMLGILAIVGGIAYMLKDIIIYIFYGIFTAIILWLTYHVVLAFYYALIALRDYEKKTSIFKNTFNKLKKYILSIYSKWYFQSKEFQQTKEYMCICAIDILMINDNALEFMMTPHQYLYIDEQDEAIKDSQNKINDFLLQKQDIFLTKLQKEQSLNSIDHKIPKIIKKYYHQTLEDKLGFYKTTLDELVSAYSLFYFQSKEFMSLKEQIATYIQNCNKLNEHINELERANLNASQRDYGNVVSIDTSLYNYNRPYYFLNNEKNTYYTTNLNLYRNAEIQPFKYFCKYFHIEKNKTTLADFEDTLNAFYTIEEGKSLLESEKTES